MELDLLKILGRDRLPVPEAGQFKPCRTVITGAGGSIGSAIAKRLSTVSPFLGLIGHSEASIFKLRNELGESDYRIQSMICDAGANPSKWMNLWRPDLVIHAAAHKHVGLMEDNPEEAFRNNTENTIRIVTAAFQCGVKKVVFISTDKAVRPTTVMGATKRLAEAWCLTRAPFVTVCRFGNVAGSSGSVIEIVAEKLLRGEQVSLTSRSMRRYFITPDEAVDLVLASTTRPCGVYTLEMGSQIYIEEVFRRIAEQLNVPLDMKVTEPIQGEKLQEHIIDSEGRESIGCPSQPTAFTSIQTILSPARVDAAIEKVRNKELTVVEAANSLWS